MAQSKFRKPLLPIAAELKQYFPLRREEAETTQGKSLSETGN